jgi:hypothetical protein
MFFKKCQSLDKKYILEIFKFYSKILIKVNLFLKYSVKLTIIRIIA